MTAQKLKEILEYSMESYPLAEKVLPFLEKYQGRKIAKKDLEKLPPLEGLVFGDPNRWEIVRYRGYVSISTTAIDPEEYPGNVIVLRVSETDVGAVWVSPERCKELNARLFAEPAARNEARKKALMETEGLEIAAKHITEVQEARENWSRLAGRPCPPLAKGAPLEVLNDDLMHYKDKVNRGIVPKGD